MIRGLSVLFAVLGAAACASAAELRWVTLQEGTNLRVSMPTDGARFAIDLMGQIWVANVADGIAAAITDPQNRHARPAFAPDGELIAAETLHNGLLHIAVMRPDGSDYRRVTFGDFDHLAPSWAPDSRHVVFTSNRGGDYSIWQVDVASLALEQLSFLPGDEWDPAWNADATQIAYIGGNAGRATLYSQQRSRTPVALVTEPNALHAPAWRPDDAVLTYVRATPNGGALRMLILSDPPITKALSSGENVFPHPVQWIGASEIQYAADGHIKRREFGAREHRVLPFRAIVGIEPGRIDPSPDEARNTAPASFPVFGILGIAEHADGRRFVAALGDLWEFAVNGEISRQLTNDAWVDSLPGLSDDGTELSFTSDRGGPSERWVLDLDTLELRRALEQDAETGMGRPLDNVPAPLSWTPARSDGRLVLRAGRLFDGIGPGYRERAEILIEAGRIVAVRDWSEEQESGTTYVDARENTVLPGLIDLGTHQPGTNTENYGRAWLAAGVTAIRTQVEQPLLAVEARESWSSGRRPGPRAYFSLPICDALVHPWLRDAESTRPAYLHPMTTAEICAGSDPREIKTAIDAAHAHGLSVASAEAYPAILFGADEVLPAGPQFGPGGARRKLSGALYNDVIDVVAELQLAIVSNLQRRPEGLRRRQVEQQLFSIVGRGGRVALGSGAPRTASPGAGLHFEMRRLVESGLQPFQVLKMATLDAARVLGRSAELGSIAPGRWADLVIVRGDPLVDIAAAGDPVAVLVGGRRFSRETLETPGRRGPDKR